MRKKGRIFRKFCLVLFLLLCVNLGYAKLEIIVKSSPDWGSISDANVEYLCQNIVDHFEKHLRPENEINEKVNVYRTFVGYNFATLDPDPTVKYKIGIHLLKDMEIRVDDFYYFILPFAHEFCHILHNFEVSTIDSPNLWFQEGVSTMAGIWALRSMAETWKNGSKFGTGVAQDGGWASFSRNFNHYADGYLKVFPEYQYDGTGEEWLEEYELLARGDSYHGRGRSTEFNTNPAQLTFKFLPIFEENPEAWNAVRKMPATKGKMSEYMQDWYDAVNVQDRQYVEAMAEIMGISVSDKAPVAIVSNDGEFVNLTFTHSSSTSLTPVNNRSDWDGWVAGIWEKTPDGNIERKPDLYYDFPKMNELDHWMYSHAPSVIEYDISRNNYSRFGSYFDITHQECVHRSTEIQFFAYADNKEIYRSDILYAEDDGIYIEFDIPKNSKKLKIRIDDVTNNWCDHYVLGAPRLYTDSAAGLEASNIDADVNNDGRIDLLDVQIVRKAIKSVSNYDTDVNNDGVTDETDVLIVKAFAHAAIAAASPRKRKVNITTWGNLKMR